MNTFKDGREGAKGLITNFENTIQTSSDEEKLKKLQKFDKTFFFFLEDCKCKHSKMCVRHSYEHLKGIEMVQKVQLQTLRSQFKLI